MKCTFVYQQAVGGVDASRGPMYWANFTNGNFTAANETAWLDLPTDPNYSVEVSCFFVSYMFLFISNMIPM